MVTLERTLRTIRLLVRRGFVLPLSSAYRDRRGVTALFFALTTAALLGFIGLATEVGSWYLARTEAYNAADAAATAGVLALAINPGDASAATAAATYIVQQNGFTVPGTNPPASPPADGNYAGNTAATEVWVSATFSPLLASLFSNQSTITVTARAVGLLATPGYACALAISGGLTIAQSQNSNGSIPCYYASNGTETVSDTSNNVGVTFSGSPPVDIAPGISSVKECINCPIVPPMTGGNDSTGQTYLARPYAGFQPPTTNPYTAIYDPVLGTGAFDVAASQIICPMATGANSWLTYTGTGTLALDPITHCPTNSTAVTVTGLVSSGGDIALNPSSPSCPLDASGAVTTLQPNQFCGYYNMDVSVASSTVTLSPVANPNFPLNPIAGGKGDATYLFVDSSLTVPSGATLQCMLNIAPLILNAPTPCAPGPQETNGSGHTGEYGVTFILTGSNVGKLTVASGAIANLAAPSANTFPGAPPGSLDGILFYRKGGDGVDTVASPGVSISDTTGGVPTGGVLLNGIMYFPSSVVAYTGNTNATYRPLCAVIVAGTLILGPLDGSGLTTQFSAGCSDYRSLLSGVADIPNVQAAQVVE
jgi:Flp pilus assembly protein TadG